MGGRIWRYDTYDITKYEPWSIRFILDIGANVGGFSLMSRILFPVSRVHSVEPNKDAFNILLSQAPKWRFHCYNFALGLDGEQLCSTREEGSQVSGFTRFLRSDECKNVEYTIPSYSLAWMFLRFGIDSRVPVIVKIDCEGGERSLLWDRERSLETIRKTIQTCVELHFGMGGTADQWISFLSDLSDTHDLLICRWYRDQYRRHYIYVPFELDSLKQYKGAQIEIRRKDWERYKRGAPPRSDGMYGDEGVNWT